MYPGRTRTLPNRRCNRRRSYGTRRATRFARVHGAISDDPLQAERYPLLQAELSAPMGVMIPACEANARWRVH